MPPCTPEDVLSFLIEMKKTLSRPNSLQMVRRIKNMQALAEIGYTKDDVRDVLYSLMVEDYYSGPEKDHDSNFPGDIWKFGKIVDKDEFYIKLKLLKSDKQIVVCLSFHKAKYPISYPFKGK